MVISNNNNNCDKSEIQVKEEILQDNTVLRKSIKKKKISRSARISIYILFTFINIIVNMDSGNIPPAIAQVKQDYNVSDTQIGAFPSLVSTGTFIGGMISLSIIDKVSMKWLLIFANLGIAICLFAFSIDFLSHISVLFINRILVGVCMSYNQAYFPIWVDCFAPKRAKAIMISIIQVGVPVGIVLGYLMTSLLLKFDVSVSENYKSNKNYSGKKASDINHTYLEV